MSIAALSMARHNAMMYNAAYGGFNAMDGKRSLANSGSTDYAGMSAKEKGYDASIQKNALDYQAGNAMYDQSKALQKEWAEGFNVFA